MSFWNEKGKTCPDKQFVVSDLGDLFEFAGE